MCDGENLPYVVSAGFLFSTVVDECMLPGSLNILRPAEEILGRSNRDVENQKPKSVSAFLLPIGKENDVENQNSRAGGRTGLAGQGRIGRQEEKTLIF